MLTAIFSFFLSILVLQLCFRSASYRALGLQRLLFLTNGQTSISHSCIHREKTIDDDADSPDERMSEVSEDTVNTAGDDTNPLISILQRSEIFQYIEIEILEKLLVGLQKHELLQGKTQTIPDSAICFVIQGEVNVYTRDITSPSRAENSSHKHPSQLLKVIKDKEMLSSMTSILSTVSRVQYEHMDGEMDEISEAEAEWINDNLFQQVTADQTTTTGYSLSIAAARGDVTLGVIPFSSVVSLAITYPETFIYMLGVLISRLYKTTLPTAQDYFGLQSEVVRTEYDLIRASGEELVVDRLNGEFMAQLVGAFDRQKRDTDMTENKGIMLRDREFSRFSTSGKVPVSPASVKPRSPWDAIRSNPGRLRLDTSSSNIQDHIKQHIIESASRFQAIASSISISRPSRDVFAVGKPMTPDCTEAFALAHFRELATTSILRSLGFVVGKETKDRTQALLSAIECSEDMFKVLQRKYIAKVELAFFPKDAVIAYEKERNPGIYYVIKGTLSATADGGNDISNTNDDDFSILDTQNFSHTLSIGSIVGLNSILVNNNSIFNITAQEESYVGFLPRVALQELVQQYPAVLLRFAKLLDTTLTGSLRMVDNAFDWMKVSPGAELYSQGGHSDSMYIIMNGRLQTSSKDINGGGVTSREYGKGEGVGAVELMTRRKRQHTVKALRSTELIRIQAASFRTLAATSPKIALQISQHIAKGAATLLESSEIPRDSGNLPITKRSIRTIALIPLGTENLIESFCNDLAQSIVDIGLEQVENVAILDHETIIRFLGVDSFEKKGSIKLAGYLGHLEERMRVIFYIPDFDTSSKWTSTCVNQADYILFVGGAKDDPKIRPIEHKILKTQTLARKKLVLIHESTSCTPGASVKWMNSRPWVTDGIQHIYRPQDTYRKLAPFGHDQEFKKRQLKRSFTVDKIFSSSDPLGAAHITKAPVQLPASATKDLQSLARRLFGCGIALVLGGGGARGIAHMGVIEEMIAKGIPIDMIGGTSYGAFVGGLYAKENSFEVVKRGVLTSAKTLNFWKLLRDATFPLVSLTTGRKMDEVVKEDFEGFDLRDFRTEFFCCVTNISKLGIPHYLSNGSAWEAIRASMSLGGLVPPMCIDGQMLMDGCYSDNLPVAYMREVLGAETIFAVSVSGFVPIGTNSYGSTLSGWKMLWHRLCGLPGDFAPSIFSILDRLTFITSYVALHKTRKTPGCYPLELNLGNYSTTNFVKLPEIYDFGRRKGREFFDKLADLGVVDGLPLVARTRGDESSD